MVNNNDTITLPRNVVEQALEALTNCTSEYGHRCNRCDSEVDPDGNVASALRAALDQPQVEQEPIGEVGAMPGTTGFTMACFLAADAPVGTKLYANQQPKREPLTEDEIFSAIRPLCNSDTTCKAIIGISMDEYRAIESAHGIECKK